jgi:hypothetical protein
MAKTSLKSFAQELSKFLVREVIKKNKPSFQKKISAAFEKIKQEMIDEFLSHSVSVEILAGLDAENSSNTLGGYGNLFSFIGFDKNSTPLEPILQLLQASKIEYGRDTQNGFLTTIYIPSAEKIFAETPMPWATGRSWAEGIERGISGFGQYLNTASRNSRSGEGVEADHAIRGGKFKNTSYISALINKYSKKFQQIDKSITITNIL